MESAQVLINIIGGISLSVLGWLGKTVWDAVQNLKEDIQHIEVELPTHYVRKDDMADRFDKLEGMINRLFEKLEKKADK